VQGSLELQLAVLRQAEADLEAWTKRYRELSEICDDVLKARDKIRTRREAAESRLHA
jgi:hypothetical protein